MSRFLWFNVYNVVMTFRFNNNNNNNMYVVLTASTPACPFCCSYNTTRITVISGFNSRLSPEISTDRVDPGSGWPLVGSGRVKTCK